MSIKVKDWKALQINDEIAKYHWVLCRHNNNDGTYTLNGRINKETEKAINVTLDTETYGEHAREYTTWIPKSCVVA